MTTGDHMRRGLLLAPLLAAVLMAVGASSASATACRYNSVIQDYKQGPVHVFDLVVEWRYCFSYKRHRVMRLQSFSTRTIWTDGGHALRWQDEGVQDDPRPYYFRWRGYSKGGMAKERTVKYCQQFCWFASISPRIHLRMHYKGPKHDNIWFTEA
jgi:hypothetical protein